MFRSFISWRYLFARRTNLIGIVGIFVAVAALILILSIMTGFLEESRRTVRGSLADLLIEPVQNPHATEPVPAGPLLAAVRTDPGVRGASAQLVWGGIITQKDSYFDRLMSSQQHGGLLAVQLLGIDVAAAERWFWPHLRPAVNALGGVAPALTTQDEFDATDLFAALTRAPRPGSLRKSSSAAVPIMPFLPPPDYETVGRLKASILIGEQLFHTLALRRGDVLQLSTAVPDPETGDWSPNNRNFVVAGTFRSGENETDLGRVYLPRHELADFLGGSRAFTQVLVRMNDYEADGERARDEWRTSLAEAGLIGGGMNAGIEVQTWEEFRGNLLGAIENERVLMAIMLSLVLVVSGFTIFAILSMMVTEKRRDIGILNALGATPRGVMELFLLIAFWDALLGAVTGAIAGTWAAIKIDAIERWLSDTFQIQIFNRDVYLFDHIPSIVQPLSVTLIVLGAFLCALLFAAIPAWRAARLDPLAALRYE